MARGKIGAVRRPDLRPTVTPIQVAEEWKLVIFKGVGKVDFKGVDNIRKRKKGKRS